MEGTNIRQNATGTCVPSVLHLEAVVRRRRMTEASVHIYVVLQYAWRHKFSNYIIRQQLACACF